ncbi:epimerase [Marivirga lumbricoides]|uniref:Epimerase n=1 Tax=Marivirga lumbricoides TaxID=1046115 RepID=A0A2T4DPT2_9BACT|nr:epimerase [Marivirga lumbricoides]
MKNNTIFITGGLGFIASRLTKKLLSQNYKVVSIDNFSTGSIKNIEEFKNDPNFSFIRGDANNYNALYHVFYNFKPDYVFHYAAYVGVLRTLNNPLQVLQDIKGFENILELSRDFNVKKILFSSSSEVYGEPVELPQNEHTTPLNSKLPYAVVKNVGEVFLKTYQSEFGLDYTIFRFFNTYGPHQSKDFVISKFLDLALNNQPITVYGDGLQTRTFCFIEDNLDATVAAMTDERSKGEIYNIGSSAEITVIDLARLIIKLTNSNSEILHLPPLKEGDMQRRKPNNNKMIDELLNGKQLVGLEDGLKETIKWFKEINE